MFQCRSVIYGVAWLAALHSKDSEFRISAFDVVASA